MTTPEERAAARDAMLDPRLDEQRKLYDPSEFLYDRLQDAYWCLATGSLLKDRAMDASIPIELWRVETIDPPEREEGQRGRPQKRKEKLVKPSDDIRRVENNSVVEGSTWWPGLPTIIHDMFVDGKGVHKRKGTRMYNRFYAQTIAKPRGVSADPWIEHIKKLWPEPKDHEFFFDYFAHMVQHPEVKCNTAVVLSGTQGIGKDAALVPIKEAAGNWNCRNIDPDDLFSQYKPWLEALLLVVDEVRPSNDEFRASSMYNILKPLIAAPPDTLMVNDKFMAARYVRNLLRVVLTTNDWMAMYLPEEDRRVFIMHSRIQQNWHVQAGQPEYFQRLFQYFAAGGNEAVAAWLAERDLSGFDPTRPVEHSMIRDQLTSTWGEPNDEITERLDALEYPDVVTMNELMEGAFDGKDAILAVMKSPRKTSNRMLRSGYETFRRHDGKRWALKKDGKQIKVRALFIKSTAAPDNISSLEEIARNKLETLLAAQP